MRVNQLAQYPIEILESKSVSTSLGIKDNRSFMISTSDWKIRVIENSSEIFNSEYKPQKTGIYDIVYCESINSYLFSLDKKIYRKDINENQHYLFLDIDCGSSFGASLRYSNIHKRLIIPMDGVTIAAVNINSKQVVIEVPKPGGDQIVDFQLHGSDQNKVSCLTQDGHLFVSELDFSSKEATILSTASSNLIEERQEQAKGLVVCPKGQYNFVEISQTNDEEECSRMMIFGIKDNELTIKAVINNSKKNPSPCKSALACLGYFKNSILFLGMSSGDGGQAHLYCYNTQTDGFEELEEERVVHHETNPTKILRFGNHFYYTGKRAGIMRLTARSKID